jgi:pyruvate/2-oxoglutarate dehydrogenase complex dihydrolipoamide dehydrogenase (E3) component
VWAAGDCTTALKFTHVGYEQGRIAARNAFRPAPLQEAFKDRVVPWVTFTEPEVAHVGLTEEQAVQRYGGRVRVSVVADRASDRARTVGETDGFAKLIAVHSRASGALTARLVGMTVVGPAAGEQIAAGALAMQARMLVARLGTTVAAYPTYNLSVRLAAARFFGPYGGERARRGRTTSADG